MPPIYQIKIAEPCHEDWNKMTPAEQGRFCSACQKQVVDFSTMTDTEVIHHLQHATASICARAGNDQLNRDIQPVSAQKSAVTKYWFALLAGISLFLSKADAQSKKPKHPKRTPLIQPDQRKRLPGEVIMGTIATVRPVGDEWTLTGTVVDEKAQPVPFASIRLGSGGIGMSADSAGRFEIEMKSRPDSMKVSISSAGFEQRNLVVYPEQNLVVDMGSVQLKLPVLQNVTVSANVLDKALTGRLGGVMIGVRVTPYEKVASGFKDLIGVSEIKVLPNPVAMNASFIVRLAPKKLGAYTIQVADINGRIVAGKKVNITTQGQLEPFEAGQFESGGVYVVSLISHADGTVYSNRLVVQ
ncbi:MAG: carboxypeptidase-like regulatory domain-containing protein [Bacteroidota bacterium]|nr:carboxypeptidase-like regulatory domain-containing protein [Bacteroidota bacterium]